LFPKNKRYENKDNMRALYDSRCVVCQVRGCDPAHIKSQGSGGGDFVWNIMPLCRRHHTESHKLGFITFAKKYDAVYKWLQANGWTMLENKLLPPKV